MIKIATPISTLFANQQDAQDLINNSDCLECRDFSIAEMFPKQHLFHCNLQPIHIFEKKIFSYLEKIAVLKKDLKLISFHMATSCSNPFLEGNIFKPGGFQYSRQEMISNAKKNFRIIKSIFGREIKIAVENNNYYPTKAYSFVTDADFIQDIVYENDIFFLYDIAHAHITSYNKCINWDDYKKQLPLDRAIQIHISRYSINNKNIAIDTHLAPDKENWKELLLTLSSNKLIQYVTIEYYEDKNKVVDLLKKTKGYLNELS